MSNRVRVRHPKLKETLEVNRRQAQVLARSGWQPDDSKTKRKTTSSDRPAETPADKEG